MPIFLRWNLEEDVKGDGDDLLDPIRTAWT
jgi:hypothetical protein